MGVAIAGPCGRSRASDSIPCDPLFAAIGCYTLGRGRVLRGVRNKKRPFRGRFSGPEMLSPGVFIYTILRLFGSLVKAPEGK